MPAQGYLPPPADAGSEKPADLRRLLRQVSAAVRDLMQGKANVTATLTLAAGATTTVLTDARLRAAGNVLLLPLTANAAAEIGNGTLYVLAAGMNNGAWTFTHANSAQADRTFRVTIIG